MAKVLLVEDDNNLREIYQARLAAEGYDISSAQDGEEALVVAKQTKPDLVISDVMMPKISGFEMLDILRNTPGLEQVKVIMLTALGQSEDRSRADSLGADKYLVKSQVTLEDIVKTAHDLLGGDEPAPVAQPTPTAPADEAAPAPAEPVAPAPTPEAEAMAVAPEPMAVATPPAEPTVEPSVPAANPTPPAPEPEPVAEPVTETAAEPSTTDEATPEVNSGPSLTMPAPAAGTDDDSAAGSTSEEEALVEQQINDFVATSPADAPVVAEPAVATPEPAQPAEAEPVAPTVTSPVEPSISPTPEPAAPPVVPPQEPAATDPTSTSSDSADDQLMADAVNELSGNQTDTEPAAVAPAADTAPEEAADDSSEADAANTNLSISGKKVIQPLNSEPKPDINDLLAREEAVNGGTVAPSVITPDSQPTVQSNVAHQPGESFAPQPETPSAPEQSKKNDDFDPNSVAL